MELTGFSLVHEGFQACERRKVTSAYSPLTSASQPLQTQIAVLSRNRQELRAIFHSIHRVQFAINGIECVAGAVASYTEHSVTFGPC